MRAYVTTIEGETQVPLKGYTYDSDGLHLFTTETAIDEGMRPYIHFPFVNIKKVTWFEFIADCVGMTKGDDLVRAEVRITEA